MDSCPALLLRPPAKPGDRSAPSRAPGSEPPRPFSSPQSPNWRPDWRRVLRRELRSRTGLAVDAHAPPRETGKARFAGVGGVDHAPCFRCRREPAAHEEQSDASEPISAQNNKAWCWSTWAPARPERRSFAWRERDWPPCCLGIRGVNQSSGGGACRALRWRPWSS